MGVGRVECEPRKGLGSATRELAAGPGISAMGLLEGRQTTARSTERVTGVAYIGQNKDGTHKVGLYNKGTHLRDIDMKVGETRAVDGIEILLRAPGSVTMRYIS